MSENARWLISCPVSDGNFKERLKRQRQMQEVTQNSKIKVLEKKLKSLTS